MTQAFTASLAQASEYSHRATCGGSNPPPFSILLLYFSISLGYMEFSFYFVMLDGCEVVVEGCVVVFWEGGVGGEGNGKIL